MLINPASFSRAAEWCIYPVEVRDRENMGMT